jgi:hypothetical protein
MFLAPLMSASIAPCMGQMTVFCCWRAHLRPHWWQVILVPAAFTNTTRLPASSALLEDIRELGPASIQDALVQAECARWLVPSVAFRHTDAT